MRLLVCSEGVEGLPFIALPRRFAAAVDELVGDRRSVACRASWRGWGWRQELAEERLLFQGRAGERAWLGRRWPVQELSGGSGG